ncbi:MAG: hypothetical protein KAR21_00090 [Spirochaetales bacterium]|nr:hypothetical protein [Spirochaetales bacterium]
MKTTELRKNIFSILDKVLDEGKPVEIERRNRTLMIIADNPPSRIERLKRKKRKKSFIGNSDEIMTIDWAAEWKPNYT